ncbi:MAG: hypothetical protein DRN40_02130 [Thermoplasmata archaeon]|nr:MAG: hypothetical protein DRN40_02130 [Thermoplasmata archaeon]
MRGVDLTTSSGGGGGEQLRRIRIEITLRGDERRLREIREVLEPEFRGEEDVSVHIILEESLQVVLEGGDLPHILATVGTFSRLLSVYEGVSDLVENCRR